ncbi:XRE family transcriptional regulator [Clostridiaceae bacterium 14S0207]|nr:XRE family transcriptional regulator [Clostridiaceae bacterium 14S0207]
MFNKNKLISILENKRWSAYKLWKSSGVSQSVISDIINGKVKNPTVKTLSKLAQALDVSVNDFFDSDNSTEEKTDIKEDLPIIPKKFTNPAEAREYVNKHQIFGSNGFDSNKLDDNEILDFANELLKQMELISFKYKK